MPTKGASNHYGGSRNGRQGKKTQHTGFAWAKDFNSRTLVDHFNRHGEQMGCRTKESYAAHAVKFANKVDRKNCVSFVDKKGLHINIIKRRILSSLSLRMVMWLLILSQQKGIVIISVKRKERPNND